jgi:hypothetical protein
MRYLLLAVLTCFSAFAATQVVILGTGSPRADPDRFGPAVAVISNDQAYLFDDGHGVVRRIEDEALMKEVRRTYQGNVRSAKDLDVY